MRLGDPLARGLLLARSHWRFCAMGKSVFRGAPSVIVLGEPPRTAYGFNPGMLSDGPRPRSGAAKRKRSPRWRRFLLDQMQLGCGAKKGCRTGTVEKTIGEQYESSSGRRQRLSRCFEQGSFAGKAGQMVPLTELAGLFCNSRLAPRRIPANSDRFPTQRLLHPERRRWSRRQKT
jgi:hypothetical protein